MAKPSKLAHVVYMTRRFDEMLDWYQKVFEAEVQYRNPAFAFLTFDDEHHRFAFADMTVISPEGAVSELAHGVGVNHVGYTYETAGDLLETYARLKDSGIIPYWQVHHGLTLSLYYQDPDGNRMEFQVDCCADAREAYAFMHGEAFARNPVGVEVDFNDLLTRYRSGALAETLLARPEGPASPIPHAHGLS
jgi:catechol-2,3-dioxygenase